MNLKHICVRTESLIDNDGHRLQSVETTRRRIGKKVAERSSLSYSSK